MIGLQLQPSSGRLFKTRAKSYLAWAKRIRYYSKTTRQDFKESDLIIARYLEHLARQEKRLERVS
jgi:hypothetical protein